MLHTHKRITAGIAALTLALATAAPAAPAAARPFDLNAQGSNVTVNRYTPPTVQATSHNSSGDGSDWAYIAAGAGAASLALIGIGGAVAGRRHRRTRHTTVAA